MDVFDEAADPGWSLLRVVPLFGLAVSVGAVAGAALAAGAELFGAVGTVSVHPADLGGIAVLVGGLVGGMLAAVGAVGALLALGILDHWGERGPVHRAWIAGGGAAFLVLIVGGLIAAPIGLASTIGVVVFAVLAAGVAAGGGLYAFERALARRRGGWAGLSR
ncbi:hypothetical protein ITJ66_05780 [Plantibacter sp. VKM Ac-2885]|uniref:hypothetical protein n=1 Tax=unclassified Plantibacter TaxID=2624265 RepID=UPI001785DC94|nr:MULTISPECIES: hypothetical protein [unclassified Plantibacter]MBD8101930.1 hypothetical protein [Plantibacter sp. CFBP 8775]MBF4511995.1 hypothetical protein [Plantibacter sp. VKM Ac-2885]